MMRALVTALVMPLITTAPAVPDHYGLGFVAAAAGEAVATVRAGCAGCGWGEAGREAAALRVFVDGKYSQHLLLSRGESVADYRITLGAVAPGRHRLTIDRDSSLSAIGAGAATIDVPEVSILSRGSDDFTAQAMAPILYARPNTIGRFTDLPLVEWYEIVSTPRGRQFRYSVIFSNEDGGTATDRLMATWGRTTDIEFVYGVEVDPNGRTLAEEFQGPDHVVTPFRGVHNARHPLEFVVTDNNMVSDAGTAAVRYAPAPELFDLTNRSREVVMDAHAWSYRVTSQEMLREGKVAGDAQAGSGNIPDPRRFVFVEACSDLENAALSFGVRSRVKRQRPYRSVERLIRGEV